MGSRKTRAMLSLTLTMLLIAGPVPVSAQDAAPGPERLWEHDPAGEAKVNDVAIDATGSILAAVFSDASLTNTDDDELAYWDLTRSRTSSEPKASHDPRPNAFTDPEGMGVVAVEQRAEGAADLIAIGREGSDGDSSQANVYVYSVSQGPESNKRATYPGEDNTQPEGAVQQLWFLDGRVFLLAHHAGTLSLLKRDSGLQYKQVDTWSPPDGETLLDVDISTSQNRLLVASREGDIGSNPTIHLRILELGDDELTVTSEDETWNKGGAVVALSENGRYALFGANDGALFYFHLEEAEASEDHTWTFSGPWTDKRSGPVTSLALTDDGLTFAAGFGDDKVRVYEQTSLEDDNPIASMATRGAFGTQASPTELTFTSDDQVLLAQAGALYAFHELQFDPDEALEALWVLPQIRAFAVSADGNRLIAATGATVRAYEQAFQAELTIDAPSAADPGTPFEVAIGVANVGSAFDTYTFEADGVPGDWSLEASPSSLSLLPGQSGNVTLNLTPAAGHPPGTVTFDVVAMSAEGSEDEPAGSETIELDIRRLSAAGLTVGAERQEVNRGQVAILSTELSNAGNVDERFIVEVDQDESWVVTIDDEETQRATVELDAQARQTLSIRLTVDEDASEGSTNTVTITARPEEGGREAETTVDLIVEPAYDATLEGPTEGVTAEPGRPTDFTVTVRNSGNTPDAYTARVTSNASNPDHVWQASLSPVTFELEPGATKELTVSVTPARLAGDGDTAEVTVSLRSDATDGIVDSASYTVTAGHETDDSPLPLVLAPLALGLAALGARRRHG